MFEKEILLNMRIMTAKKLQSKDSVPAAVIKDKLFIGGIGAAYNKLSM